MYVLKQKKMWMHNQSLLPQAMIYEVVCNRDQLNAGIVRDLASFGLVHDFTYLQLQNKIKMGHWLNKV